MVKNGPVGASSSVRCVTTPQLDFSVLDVNGFVDRNRACGAALNVKLLWRQVCPALESDGQRYGGPAVGELEIDFDGQRIALAADLVGFFPDGLLKFVEGELALFQQRSLIRSRLSSKCDSGEDKNQTAGNGEKSVVRHR